MVIFNALLNLRELKELYSGKPVCVCPLYKGVINAPKTFEATGNPIVLPEYKSLEKLNIEFSPKQAGSGDPSPENVRPISGYDSVTVTQSKDEAQVKQITLTLPETIYGGTVDAVTGVGSKEYLLLELTGKETWRDYEYSSKASFYAIDLLNTNYVRADGICNCGIITTKSTDIDGAYIWLGVNNKSIYFIDAKREFGVNNVAEWKSYLAAKYDAGTPVTICYKLATPEPFEISKISIPSLIGENTFFTNGDNMDIIYKKEFFWGDEA